MCDGTIQWDETMANRLRIAAEWLTKRQAETAAETVVYRRPGIGEVSVPAVFASRTEQEEDASGITVYAKRPDFMVRPSDLVIGGVAIRPRRGDEITVTNEDGTKTVYELLDFPYQDSTRFGIRWRINTSVLRVI